MKKPRDVACFTWVLRDFLSLTSNQESENFEADGFFWRLACYPRVRLWTQISVLIRLEYPAAVFTPAGSAPSVKFSACISHQQPDQPPLREEGRHTFTQTDYISAFLELPRELLTPTSGYLRSDGALEIQVEIQVLNKRPRTIERLGDDLLSLLQNPDDSSNLTVTAGGRSFAVHRLILAARCPYFKTLFASGFSDSTAREHELPDANPEALELLLRAVYGGVLDTCPRELLKPAAELADRLQLTDFRNCLHDRLEASASNTTVVGDMLWAFVYGHEALLGKLEAIYLDNADGVADADLAVLIAEGPQLMMRLHKQLAAKAKARGKAGK